MMLRKQRSSSQFGGRLWRHVFAFWQSKQLNVDSTYHGWAEPRLTQVTVAASTNSDRIALKLLSNQFANLAKWASNVVAERQAFNGARTADPNVLQNNPVLTKMSNCDRFLSAMLV